MEVALVSGPPQTIPKFLTVINPFDRYVWAFSLASLGAVTIALLIIDKKHATWTKGSSKGESFQGKLTTIRILPISLYQVVHTIIFSHRIFNWNFYR